MDSPFNEYLPTANETNGYSDAENSYETPFVDNLENESGYYEGENPEEHEFADTAEGQIANEQQDSGYQSGETMDYQVATLPLVATLALRSDWHRWFPGTTTCPAEPLVDGKTAFASIANAIKTAKNNTHYIYILGWTMEIDWDITPGAVPPQSLYSLLADASRKGVEIRMVVWDNPFDMATIKEIDNAYKKINALSNSACIKDNYNYGSPVLKFAISKARTVINTVNFLSPILNLSSTWRDTKKRINTVRSEGSHHEKIVIVKGDQGLIGFCGGMDFNSNRLFNHLKPKINLDSMGRSNVLHDAHCKLMGQAAGDLLKRFVFRWNVLKGVISHPALNKSLRGEADSKSKIPNPNPASPYNANVKILHTYNHPKGGIKDRGIREAVRLAISKAKRTIYLEDQYMISLEIADWLNAKIKEPSFQNVTVLTQDDDIAKEDIQFPKQMREKFMTHLLKGVSLADIKKGKVFVKQLERNTPLLSHHKVHSKIYIIDEELAIIGSANCSSRSMTHDTETAAVIFSEPGQSYNFGKQFSSLIKTDPQINSVLYKPNPKVRDKDDEIKAEVRSALGVAGFATALAVDKLVDALKPLVIDIFDPDADNTQPQQEVEENLLEGLTGLEAPVFPDNFNEEVDLQQYNVDDSETIPDTLSETPFTDSYQLSEVIEQQVATVKTAAPAKPVEGHTSWAKSVLNQIQGAGLTIDNRMDAATKKAIRDFQSANGLTTTERIDHATEKLLLETAALQRHKGTPKEKSSVSLINTAKTKIEDWTAQAEKARVIPPVKPEIMNAYRDPRKLWAFVLHHMAFKRMNQKTRLYSDPMSYIKTGAHFCILFDGKIIQLHPLSRMVWHSNCTSPRSIGVEFEGNFPNINGKWWIPRDPKDKTKFVKYPDKDKPTPAQYEAGRFLACYLQIVLGTTHIFAHRQSSKDRENDPGPDVWFNVGQWAIDNLGMTDGGATFKCGDGFAIESKWRTWGTAGGGTVTKEYGEEEGYWEGEFGETDEVPSYEEVDLQQYGTEDTETNLESLSEIPFTDNEANYNESQDELTEVIEQQVAIASGAPRTIQDDRRVWAKTILNNLQGTNLPLTNTWDAATEKAMRDFQQANKLSISGKIHPFTEIMLLEKDALRRLKGTTEEMSAIALINTARSQIEDWSREAEKARIKSEITYHFRDPRKVKAFVLHQTAYKSGRPGDPKTYLRMGAHFLILQNGKIIQLHPMSRRIWHAQCLSRDSVSVEFEGNFPDVKGKWWVKKGQPLIHKDKPTEAQFNAGRFLTSYLRVILGITNIHAHRQSSNMRTNDPGPDIWYNVGQWAIDKFRLTDGGPGFQCGNGIPILPAWRTWGTPAAVSARAAAGALSGSVSKEYGEDEGYWVNEYGETDEVPSNETVDVMYS